MALIQARVLYDFDGQPDTSELSVSANEVITITRQDIGEGWWEGLNSRGQTGLFPASYVELLSAPPPAIPPPPLPTDYSSLQTENGMPLSSSYPSTPHHQVPSGGSYDDWDDEWDDDEPTPSDQGHSNNQGSGGGGGGGFGLALPSREARSSSTGDVSSIGKGDSAGKGAFRRNFNRFSTFVKSGGEDFILGKTKINVVNDEMVRIVETEDGILIWAPNPNPYHCSITSPKKESKLKGLKSYIAYQITPSFNSIQVSRRFKHFDWLHQRLEEKFSLIPIPPIPDKQISGRYEDSFIEHRMVRLQNWVDRITRHPVLSQCEVIMHFLTCTDDKRWKQGKRRAEKDELLGASFFHAIETPQKPLDIQQVENQTENFARFVKSMDDGVKNLQTLVIDQIKKHTGPYKREWQKVGHAFRTLAISFEMDTTEYSRDLTSAVKHTGETYDNIGSLFEEQPKYDLEPMGDVLHEYKGMLAEFPEILTVHRGSLNKTREYEKLTVDGKVDTGLLQEVRNRMDVVSYASLAEINHFQSERVTDFNKMMKEYLTEQIRFYEKIVVKLQESLATYK